MFVHCFVVRYLQFFQGCGLLCGLGLWHFLVILTCLNMNVKLFTSHLCLTLFTSKRTNHVLAYFTA